MRIYADRRHYDDELDKFIGQDIWIYTTLMCSNPSRGRYVRIVDKKKALYVINCVKKQAVERIVLDHDMADFTNAQKCEFKFTVAEVTASVVHPLEIMTTEELFDGILE